MEGELQKPAQGLSQGQGRMNHSYPEPAQTVARRPWEPGWDLTPGVALRDRTRTGTLQGQGPHALPPEKGILWCHLTLFTLWLQSSSFLISPLNTAKHRFPESLRPGMLGPVWVGSIPPTPSRRAIFMFGACVCTHTRVFLSDHPLIPHKDSHDSRGGRWLAHGD